MLFVVYNSTGQSDIFLAACRLTDFLLGHRKVGSTRCYAQPFCITNPLYTYSGIPTTLPGSGFISLQTFLHIATRVFFQKCKPNKCQRHDHEKDNWEKKREKTRQRLGKNILQKTLDKDYYPK